MDVVTEVLIIGGGATGVGIARDLSMRGLHVTLCEKDGLGGGTSGRSHGLLHSGARYADSDPQGAIDCINESKILKDIAGVCVEDTGGIFVQFPNDDPEYYNQKIEACESVGIPTNSLSSDEVSSFVPELNTTFERAFYVPDGIIWPSRLVAANAANALTHGADIHINSPVESVNFEDDTVKSVYIGGNADMTVRPKMVVNATGAWAEKLSKAFEITISMKPTRGVMIAVENSMLDVVINRCRPSEDGDIIVPHEDEVVLGTTSVPVDSPEDFETDFEEVETVLSQGYKMIPALENDSVVRKWWGVRPLYDDTSSDSSGRDVTRGYTVMNHEIDGLSNVLSVLGGKLTTYRLMAEEASDEVCDLLGVEDAECETHNTPMRFTDNAEKLDEMVRRYQAVNPTGQNLY